MRNIIFFLLAFAGFSCTQTPAGAQNKLAPAQFETMLSKEKNAQLIDVRTPEEFKSGHIAGATLLNFYDDDFATRIARLDKSKPVMVYCAAGGRSGKTAKQLTTLGFTQVFDLDGGFDAWEEAGKPVEK